MKIDRSNIRSRLTGWYVLFLSVILLAHMIAAVVLLSWLLKNQLFHDEIQDLETTEGLIYQAPDGSIAMNEDYFNNPQVRMRLDRHCALRPAGASRGSTPTLSPARRSRDLSMRLLHGAMVGYASTRSTRRPATSSNPR